MVARAVATHRALRSGEAAPRSRRTAGRTRSESQSAVQLSRHHVLGSTEGEDRQPPHELA
eukprot:6807129-Alexandrium_andersonii.AAC.1